MSSSRIRDMENANFGTLNARKNNNMISYDIVSNTFVLISPDDMLENSVDDNDLPDDFIDVMEQEINLSNVKFNGVDGGSF
jgi:hypothetical protein